ncbi:hypothetical protein HON01_12320, partial [Candidatus Woesearchaeota archaeon]|nr:hypothetical protein [Candidatus Woesearchaeota archaeon]
MNTELGLLKIVEHVDSIAYLFSDGTQIEVPSDMTRFVPATKPIYKPNGKPEMKICGLTVKLSDDVSTRTPSLLHEKLIVVSQGVNNGVESLGVEIEDGSDVPQHIKATVAWMKKARESDAGKTTLNLFKVMFGASTNSQKETLEDKLTEDESVGVFKLGEHVYDLKEEIITAITPDGTSNFVSNLDQKTIMAKIIEKSKEILIEYLQEQKFEGIEPSTGGLTHKNCTLYVARRSGESLSKTKKEFKGGNCASSLEIRAANIGTYSHIYYQIIEDTKKEGRFILQTDYSSGGTGLVLRVDVLEKIRRTGEIEHVTVYECANAIEEIEKIEDEKE